jgi:hypothetical protein
VFKNTSKTPIYLESGPCEPGTTCEITPKEAKMLTRQGFDTMVDEYREVLPPPVPVPEPEPVKKSLSPPPLVTPDQTLTPTIADSSIEHDQSTDEFGPLKGTDEWGHLTPTQKMLITRGRNQKYGPL